MLTWPGIVPLSCYSWRALGPEVGIIEQSKVHSVHSIHFHRLVRSQPVILPTGDYYSASDTISSIALRLTTL